MHRFSVGDVLLFTSEWDHDPPIPGGRRAREGTITRVYVRDGVLAYAFAYRLANGARVTRQYTAKPLPRADPAYDPDGAIDTVSPNLVRYLHS